MLLKLLQPSNACLCILVTLSKIFVFSQPLINLFVFVSIIALQFSLLSYTLLSSATFILLKLPQYENE